MKPHLNPEKATIYDCQTDHISTENITPATAAARCGVGLVAVVWSIGDAGFG
jgi:hypothetical protein